MAYRDPIWSLGAGTLTLLGCTSSLYLYHHLRSTFKVSREALRGKGVLITGCDSGIGYSTAKLLTEDYPELLIFAACLTGAGCDNLDNWAALGGNANLTVLQLDVTQDASVTSAVECVTDVLGSSGKLLAVVNNAGVYDGFYVELTPVESFGRVMDVAYLGVVRVSKAFLPLLTRGDGGGRLVNVTSTAALFSAPANAAYSAAKHAVKAFSDALRAEVRCQGVEVIQVVPSAVRTPSLAAIPKCYIKLASKAKSEVATRYGGINHAKFFATLMKDYLKNACEPDAIAKVIAKSLTSSRPKALYYAGPGGRLPIPFSMMPMFVIDMLFVNPVKSVDKMITIED